jgi:biopolymer transport protein ExbB
MGAISDLLGLIAKGGIIMFPIFLCSIIALAIVIERIVFFRKYFVDGYRFLNSVLNLIKECNAENFLDQCKNPLMH